MKLLYLSLVLLITCVTCTLESSPLTHSHASLRRSLLQEREANLVSSGLPPPELNTTESLCFYLALPEIAAGFSKECGITLTQLVLVLGSEEEESVIEDLCTVDCGMKLIQFIAEECKDPVVASSLVSLCAESEGIPCHHITNNYNWTALESNCVLSLEGNAEQCSDGCFKSVLHAVNEVGCCSNYDYILSLRISGCGIDIPEHCPDPFIKDEEIDKEDEEKLGEDNYEGSSTSNIKPISLILLSLIILCIPI